MCKKSNYLFTGMYISDVQSIFWVNVLIEINRIFVFIIYPNRPYTQNNLNCL
ncbi:hypothetical protein YERSI8AC_750002 [Enterobacterales bacterium 8AC]|nr:hypothetical protein YERSI8AC_750002 [Enterobacterales bacterium 8AC]